MFLLMLKGTRSKGKGNDGNVQRFYYCNYINVHLDRGTAFISIILFIKTIKISLKSYNSVNDVTFDYFIVCPKKITIIEKLMCIEFGRKETID